MDLFKIGQLSKRTNVGVETLRFYEKEGLLEAHSRMSSGYRLYNDDSVKKVLFIRAAKQLGFSLKEIQELISLKLDPNTTCSDIQQRAEAKLLDVREKVQVLQRIEKTLETLVEQCKLNQVSDCCPLLDSLDHEASTSLKSEV